VKALKCPYCGSESGYYKLTRIHGIGVFSYTSNRLPDDENGQLHDNLTYKEMKTAYCCNCHMKINLRSR